MNKARRKEIRDVIRKLQVVEQKINANVEIEIIEDALEDIRDDISFIYDAEDEYMQNMPENLQNGTRYEIAEEACDNLSDAMDSLEGADCQDKDDVIKSIAEAIQHLNDAAM